MKTLSTPSYFSKLRQRAIFLACTAGLGLSLLSGISSAQTIYISDVLYVPMRKGPSNQHTILHRGLKSGTKLKRIKTEGNWVQASLDDGTIGWVPKQYVAENEIAALKLDAANRSAERNATRYKTVANQLKALKAENTSLKQQLGKSEEGASTLNTELSQIKQVSANAIALNGNYQQLAKDHQILQTDLDVAKAETERLKSESSQKWFMYGAGAVLLGVFIALLAPTMRPKKRHSEWG